MTYRKPLGISLIVLGLGLLGARAVYADGIGRDFMDPEVINPAPCTIWFGLPCHQRIGVIPNLEDGPSAPLAPPVQNPIRDFIDAAEDAIDRIETETETIECPIS